MAVHVKICGITRLGDALAAVEAGADYLGFNFVAGPRRLERSAAETILRDLPAGVTPVALVKLAGGLESEWAAWLRAMGITRLQVYGDTSAEALAAVAAAGFEPWAACSVRDEQLSGIQVTGAAALVLDTHDPQRWGGTGRTFCWDWVVAARAAGRLAGWPPIILAGGLRPDNVAEAVRTVRPFAVDVSSGVEVEGQPGIKDVEKMRAFVRNARSAGE